MIKYQDFAPRINKRGTLFGPAEYESFSDVVSAVNQWIENSTIQVMNVETVVLPDSLESTSDGIYGVAIGNGFYPVFLCSDAASYMTGQPLVVDGGATAS